MFLSKFVQALFQPSPHMLAWLYALRELAGHDISAAERNLLHETAGKTPCPAADKRR